MQVVDGNLAKTTEYKNYFESFVTDGSARVRLLSSVHHSHNRKHSANIIRLMMETHQDNELNTIDDVIKDEERRSVVNTFASDSVFEITDVDQNDFFEPSIYFSVNEFIGLRRTANNCYCINCFFIDLDGHDIPKEELKDELEKAKNILNDAFNDGTLCVPTKITYTGRGYGIFYVLERSIATRTEKTRKLIKFYDAEYKWLIKAYERVLGASGSRLDVDAKVTDKSRVCRMPDTFNYKAGEYCRLYDTEDVYYTLDDIKNGCHLQDFVIPKEEYNKNLYKQTYTKKDGKKTGKRLNKSKITDFTQYRTSSLMNGRIAFFNALQNNFIENGIEKGKREELCFQLYNSLVQTTDRAEAKELTRTFNNNFSEPISESRLIKQTFAGVDRVKDGHYVFTNDKICQKLGIDYSLASSLGLLTSNKAMEREEAKKRTAERKQSREEVILTVKKANMDKTREELLRLVNDALKGEEQKPISIRTLDRILKKNGLGRAGSLPYEFTAEYKHQQKKKTEKAKKKIRTFSNEKKLPKIAPVYCSVPSGGAGLSPASENSLNSIRSILSSFVGIKGNIYVRKHLYYPDITITQEITDSIYNNITDLSVLNINKVNKGLSFISTLYNDSNDFSMLFNSLDALLRGITTKDADGNPKPNVIIKVNDVKVPVTLYISGTAERYYEWKRENEKVDNKASVPVKVITEWEKKFNWLRNNRYDIYSDYNEMANIYTYLQINLKKNSPFAEYGYKVGDKVYKGSDICHALYRISLTDLEETPILKDGWKDAFEMSPFASGYEKEDPEYDHYYCRNIWTEKTVRYVQYWLNKAVKKGYKLSETACKRPRMIYTVCRYKTKPKTDNKIVDKVAE